MAKLALDAILQEEKRSLRLKDHHTVSLNEREIQWIQGNSEITEAWMWINLRTHKSGLKVISFHKILSLNWAKLFRENFIRYIQLDHLSQK